MTIKIGNYIIDRNSKPFIVAEMSGNHNHSLARALKIVEEAAKCGVHAVKLQTYTADTMTLNLNKGIFFIDDPESPWYGKNLYQLYKNAYTPWEWHKPIFDRCQELGLVAFSSPFDESAVDFLEKLNVPCYKIASFENVDIPLIYKVARTGKPLIISTGMASISELDEAVHAVRKVSNSDIILLKCTSSYPSTPQNANLLTIPHMRELFGCEVGLSDHTLGIGVSIASIALGATFIERHFTIDRSEGGVDAVFSIEPEELKALVLESERAWQAMGKISYGPTNSEKLSLSHRRSLYIVSDMKSGDTFTKENLRVIRPSLGLPPKFYDIILGKRIVKNVTKGTPMSWELLG